MIDRSECDMKASEIEASIAQGLEDPAIQYYAGMYSGDKNDLVCSVQREEHTIAECIVMVTEWATEEEVDDDDDGDIQDDWVRWEIVDPAETVERMSEAVRKVVVDYRENRAGVTELFNRLAQIADGNIPN